MTAPEPAPKPPQAPAAPPVNRSISPHYSHPSPSSAARRFSSSARRSTSVSASVIPARSWRFWRRRSTPMPRPPVRRPGGAVGAEVPGEEVPGAAGQRMRRQAFQRKGQGASSVDRRQQRHTPPRLVEDRRGPADVGCGMTLPEVLPDPMAERLSLVRAHLDERAWRLLLGAEAKVLVRGGIKAVSAACGAHPDTVAQGVRELDYPDPIPGRVRRPGAGRPGVASTDPTSSPPAGNGNLPETPDRWNVHDFEDKKLGKVASYGGVRHHRQHRVGERRNRRRPRTIRCGVHPTLVESAWVPTLIPMPPDC